MADELKTMAEELKTTAISKLPEAISVSEGDCILVVQNRKAKKARPSLFRGPKGDIGLTGATGANPVLKFSSRGIEAKLSNQADSAFTLLVPIASITGPTGPQGLTGATGANIIPRAGETGIEYKLSTEPDTAYRLLVPYSQITGPQGEPGKDFQILGYFDTFSLLETTIVNPNPGDAYGVGTAAPYPIYIWDAIGERWRDNGAIQGPAGRSGKSARVNKETGYWEEFDDDVQTWRQTEYIAVYTLATTEQDGLMSKEAVAKVAKIITTGTGTKALLDNGEYGTVSGGGGDAFDLPIALMSLDATATSEDIKSAVGGDEGFDTLLQAMMDKKIMRIYLEGNYIGINLYQVDTSDSSMTTLAFMITVGSNSSMVMVSRTNDKSTYIFQNQNIPSEIPVIVEEDFFHYKERRDRIIEAMSNKQYICLYSSSSSGPLPAYIEKNGVDLGIMTLYGRWLDTDAASFYLRYRIVGEDGNESKRKEIGLLLDLTKHENESYDLEITNKGDGTKALFNDGSYKTAVTSEDIIYIKKLTQAAYNALSVKDNRTLYVIVD